MELKEKSFRAAKNSKMSGHTHLSNTQRNQRDPSDAQVECLNRSVAEEIWSGSELLFGQKVIYLLEMTVIHMPSIFR